MIADNCANPAPKTMTEIDKLGYSWIRERKCVDGQKNCLLSDYMQFDTKYDICEKILRGQFVSNGLCEKDILFPTTWADRYQETKGTWAWTHAEEGGRVALGIGSIIWDVP